MSAEPASTLPALVASRGARHDGATGRSWSTTTTRSPTPSSTTRAARWPDGSLAAGVGKGARVGLLMPNGIEWAVDAVAVMRIGAVLVPLSTLLRPPELEAQLRTAGVARADRPARVPRPALPRRARRAPPRPPLGRLHPSCGTRALPNLRRLWSADALPTDVGARRPWPRRWSGRCGRPTTWSIMFTSGSRGTPQGRDPHPRRRHPGDGRRPRGPVHRRRATGSTSRCRSSGWAASAAACSRCSSPARRCSPRPTRRRRPTIRFLERERATLFRGWPDQAARIAADPAFAAADLSSLRAGSLDAVLPPELRAAPGARANLFGMTESFGPYCGSRLDTDLARPSAGAAARPFAGVEVRIVDPDDGGAGRRRRAGGRSSCADRT